MDNFIRKVYRSYLSTAVVQEKVCNYYTYLCGQNEIKVNKNIPHYITISHKHVYTKGQGVWQ